MARKYKRDSRGRFAGGGGRVSGSRGAGPKGGVQRKQQPKRPPTPAQKAAAQKKLLARKRAKRIQQVNTALRVGIVAAPLIASTAARGIHGTQSFTAGFRQGMARGRMSKQAARAAVPIKVKSVRL